MRYDFTYVQALESRAHRERAEALYRLILAPILSLFRENPMKLTYDAILNDPSLLERIRLDAHRERAEAVHRILLSFKNFLTSHAARPHLARQG